jgi:uncharacterized protein YuzE
MEFRDAQVAETRDLDESTVLDLDADGNVLRDHVGACIEARWCARSHVRASNYTTTHWRPTLDCGLPSLSLRSVAIKRGSAWALNFAHRRLEIAMASHNPFVREAGSGPGIVWKSSDWHADREITLRDEVYNARARTRPGFCRSRTKGCRFWATGRHWCGSIYSRTPSWLSRKA